jgi:hypothetical protein
MIRRVGDARLRASMTWIAPDTSRLTEQFHGRHEGTLLKSRVSKEVFYPRLVDLAQYSSLAASIP